MSARLMHVCCKYYMCNHLLEVSTFGAVSNAILITSTIQRQTVNWHEIEYRNDWKSYSKWKWKNIEDDYNDEWCADEEKRTPIKCDAQTNQCDQMRKGNKTRTKQQIHNSIQRLEYGTVAKSHQIQLFLFACDCA